MASGNMVIRKIIFYPMLWVRSIFLLIGKILGAFFAFGGIVFILVNGVADGKTLIPGIICLVVSFFTFILRFSYDKILLKLNPTGNDLTLTQ